MAKFNPKISKSPEEREAERQKQARKKIIKINTKMSNQVHDRMVHHLLRRRKK